MSRVYVVRCQKSRMGNEESPSRDLAFERGRTSGPPAVLFASTQKQPELPHLAKLIVELCSLDQPNHSFQAHAVSIEEITFAAKGAALASWKESNGI